MVPVIYTTYGIAMRHQPEVLAESGGLRSAGVGEIRDRTTKPARANTCQWLEVVLRRLGLRHREVDSWVEAPSTLASTTLRSTGR
jgi:hypothetical protein